MKNVRTARGEILNFEELIIKQALSDASAKKDNNVVQQIKQNPAGLTMDMFSKISTTGVTITDEATQPVVKDESPNGIVDVNKRKIAQPVEK